MTVARPMSHNMVDATDLAVLDALQEDGRASMAEVGRRVSMSPTAVADRVRRLTDSGVIRGFTAVVEPARLGFPLHAFARVRIAAGTGGTFLQFLAAEGRVTQAHHLTGDDCYLLEVVAEDMAALEALTGQLAPFGQVTTNVVFSSPVRSRMVTSVPSDRLDR